MAGFLLTGVVAIGGVAVERYVGVRDTQRAVLAELRTQAHDLAREARRGGSPVHLEPAQLRSALANGGRVSVVSAGATDDFGITRGAEVSSDSGAGDGAAPTIPKEAWNKRIMDRSAELASEIEAGRVPPAALTQHLVSRPSGPPIGIVYAPISAKETYRGAVILARELTPPSPRSTVWTAILFALMASGLLWVGTRRHPSGRLPTWVSGLLVGLCAAAPVIGGVPGLWVATALLGLGLGACLNGPLAALCHGIRTQPSTYGYVAPAVVGLSLLVFVPFVMGIAIAFFDKSGDFVGLDHFTEVLVPSTTQQTDFWQTLGITVLWTFSNVVLHVGIGVALALVLNRPNLRFKGLYRVLLILPWAVPNYITALVWRGMFDSTNGAVNALLGVFGADSVTWLGDGGTLASNFLANLTTNVWLGFPFMMVVTLGALQSIPSSLYEAAEIDGATRLQRFRFVTMPLLKPALVPAIVLGTIWTFNMFNVIYLVSRGAPGGQTEIMITEAYKAFWILERPGLAAAYAIMIFVVLLAYGVTTDRVTKASQGAFE